MNTALTTSSSTMCTYAGYAGNALEVIGFNEVMLETTLSGTPKLSPLVWLAGRSIKATTNLICNGHSPLQALYGSKEELFYDFINAAMFAVPFFSRRQSMNRQSALNTHRASHSEIIMSKMDAIPKSASDSQKTKELLGLIGQLEKVDMPIAKVDMPKVLPPPGKLNNFVAEYAAPINLATTARRVFYTENEVKQANPEED